MLLGCAASVAVVTVGMRGGPVSLFSLDPSEVAVDSDFLQGSLDSSAVAGGFSGQARAAMLAAKQDQRELATASRHEAAAQAVIKGDMAQLSSLYSGSWTAADPLGLQTGNLPTLEGLTNYNGRFSSSADEASAAGAASAASLVTDTQLSGLQSELSALNGQKQSIIDSLSLRRQRTATKVARDASYSDALRLHRAVSESSARAFRDEQRVARIASQRAKEASVIMQNEEAIAQIAAKRASKMGAYRDAAIAGASQAESDIQGMAHAAHSARRQRYAAAYRATTQQLQKYVAEDMATLGQLRKAEEKAAFGPRIGTSVWQQPPTSRDLPDIDPSYFMGDAPFRNATTLPEFKSAPDAATQLSEQEVPAEGNGDSILRVMREADSELAALDKQKEAKKRDEELGAREGARHDARLRAVHTKVAAQLQQLRAVAGKEGVDTGLASATGMFGSSSGASRVAVDVSAAGDHELLAVSAQASAAPADAAGASGGQFTSFPEASLKTVQGSRGDMAALDDGELIRHARAPVARVAVPLGAHQDATKPRRGAVTVPKPTIVDASTEAMAVRADGTHHVAVAGDKRGGSSATLRMPHVKQR